MKIIVAFIFFLQALGSCAQTSVYHPFPEDTATWLVDFVNKPWMNNTPSGYCNSTLYRMNGDTVFNSVSYNKLYSSLMVIHYTSFPSPPLPGSLGYNIFSTQYQGAIRQDTIAKKVFYRDATMTADTLLYDFNLNFGDTLPELYQLMLPYPTIITGMDSIPINGKYHKRYQMNNNTTPMLIEGVGWSYSLLFCYPQAEFAYSLACFNKNSIAGGSFVLECNLPISILMGAEMLMGDSGAFDISPNPSTGIFNLAADESFSYSVMDVYGREIIGITKSESSGSTVLDMTQYDNGIYFVRIGSERGISVRKIILQ